MQVLVPWTTLAKADALPESSSLGPCLLQWTEFFRGPIGSEHVFGQFEAERRVEKEHGLIENPLLSIKDAVDIQASLSTGAAIEFSIDDQTIMYFGRGIQCGWRPLRNVRVTAGEVEHLPTWVWCGSSSTHQGFILVDDDPQHTFASSYNFSDEYDRCNGKVLIGGETLSLRCRVVGHTSACAATEEALRATSASARSPSEASGGQLWARGASAATCSEGGAASQAQGQQSLSRRLKTLLGEVGVSDTGVLKSDAIRLAKELDIPSGSLRAIVEAAEMAWWGSTMAPEVPEEMLEAPGDSG